MDAWNSSKFPANECLATEPRSRESEPHSNNTTTKAKWLFKCQQHTEWDFALISSIFEFNSTDRYRNMAKVAVAPAVHSFSDLRPSSRALTITPRPASRKSAGFGTLDRPSPGNISRGRNVAVSSRGSKGVASSMLIIRPGRRDSSGSSLGKRYKQLDDPLSVFNLLLFYFNYDLISRRSFHFNFCSWVLLKIFKKSEFPYIHFPT